MARKNQYPARVFTDTHASCGKCASMKPFTEFHKCKGQPRDIAYWCKSCAIANARFHHNRRKKTDPAYQRSKRNGWLKKAHGISLQVYEERLIAQNCKCAICGIALLPYGYGTHLDHCHATGKLRAFLCTNCNRGLGSFKDNVHFLDKAIQYLNTHNNNVAVVKEDIVNDRSH